MGDGAFHRIAYSEWGSRGARRVVVCAHGLTRNRHDFAYLAAALARDFRVVAFDFAGRGDSDWLPSDGDYRFSLYQQDAAALIARVTASCAGGWLAQAVGRLLGAAPCATVDWVGTSMGGLVGMALAAKANTPIRRLVLNDVGPLVPWTGLVRIKGYSGKADHFPSLEEAESYLREVCEGFGELTDAQWRHLAEHSVRKLEDGSYGLNYDPDIIHALRRGDHLDIPLGARFLEGIDLWAVWDQVKAPTLVLRGLDSDLLTERVAREMGERGPKAKVIEFPGVGHAPALMESAQIEPIRAFLRRKRL